MRDEVASRVIGVELRLDEHHLLVSVDWTTERGDREPVRPPSTFLLRRETAGLRLHVYLNHHDLASLLAAT